MAAEPTRIVSLTITEGGYNVHDTTGEFDAANPAVVADLQPGAVPRTVFGLVTEALRRRRDAGLAPFTVMSCDNLQGNGTLARRAFTAFARLRAPALGYWVGTTVRFPNSMVDRITPVTTDADRAEIAERFGIADRWPVVCEPFTQWVLQDDFAAGRPPYEAAGVQVVPDVEPYELMKLRLLNGSHQAMAYFGYLAGYRLVHQAAQDPLFRAFLLGYMNSEAAPTLPLVPGAGLGAYQRTLLDRFANPEIRDTIARLCEYTSDRIPKWVLPVVRQQLRTGGEIRRGAAVVASWARYAEGTDEQGRPIEVVDHRRDRLMRLAQRQRTDPGAFIGNRDIFGSLADDDRFVTAYRAALDLLHQRGARATLESLA
jgi:mannitol 2-dehydrogenase